MANDVRGLRSRLALLSALCLAALGSTSSVAARGDSVVPVYEGWYANADGSFNLVFGYFNRNWDQEFDLPVGPANTLDPGGPDRGQPTHFYPRRSKFMFRVQVPKDFGEREVVWALTTSGKTERAYGTLKPGYIIDKGVLQANYGATLGGFPDNVEPELHVIGEQTQQAKVGVPIVLTAKARDDGKPKEAPMRPVGAGTIQVPTAATGLRFCWLVYRGAAGAVTFDPPQFSAWEDYREGRNSPHSPGWITPPVPPDGTWVVRATISEPGTYVLRALAHDGGLATVRDVTITVAR
jgi:hypothetical protein